MADVATSTPPATAGAAAEGEEGNSAAGTADDANDKDAGKGRAVTDVTMLVAAALDTENDDKPTGAAEADSVVVWTRLMRAPPGLDTGSNSDAAAIGGTSRILFGS